MIDDITSSKVRVASLSAAVEVAIVGVSNLLRNWFISIKLEGNYDAYRAL